MTEEEYFRKNYPDACYGDKPLSPYWDYFQDGVEFGERESEKKIKELEAQIEKMKGYAKLLQDICTVMGNDPYMVSVGLENRVKVLWDSSEEKDGLKMVEDIENRLLKIKPQDWAEIEKWEIKEKC